jgi:hypothetical protein
MGGPDVFCGDIGRCPGRPRCRMIQFGQIEMNRSGEGYSGQAQIVAGRATGAAQLAADFSGHDKRRHFCRSSGDTGPVHHFVADAGC